MTVRMFCLQTNLVLALGHYKRKQDILRLLSTLPVFITCSAVAFSRVLRTALVPYGKIETSTPHSFETSQVITTKLCTFD